MAIELYSDVILTADLPEHDLCIGDVGTVVDHHCAPGNVDGYSVEFFDMTGQTLAVALVPADNVREPTPSDRPSVRTPARADI